ncbi:MFS general substrate transporter [Aspergillus brunneoviolaceus CBS 621.78]|uniref:MFS general substrate transporter n=1 Tax=Aspergillus brunneoviolaceus CBS 621.78 TaxID=1450534 RepID=A0ACD1GGR3_9EURO|nr:MFS general substrate transporter [Aspergillus brunneoviolaceus CBS 621.78]RAH48304.1 MFS general substrate transporter [Aspergillus brunneoviolaceus CBS 621.78]
MTLSDTTKIDPKISASVIMAESKEDIVADNRPQSYTQGARLHLITAALALCLFLANLEIPIVTTALISITEELGGLNKIYWITTAYMLGYAGLLVISAKFSDVFERESSLLVAIFLFVVLSGACGAAETMEQLIVFRSFQGIGGASNYSICAAIILDLVPPEKYATYMSSLSIVYAVSLLCGPLMGGAISASSTWRWVFLLNVPPGALVGIGLAMVLPNRFPHRNEQPMAKNAFSLWASLRQTIRKVDMLGFSMLLVATIFQVTALEEANQEFHWSSAFTIALLTISGLMRVTLSSECIKPVFPWRFLRNRVWMGMLLNSICLDTVWFSTMFQLPQRFQIVNQLTPLQAAVRFIPFTVAAPVASVPLIYLVLSASLLQVVSYVLLGAMPESLSIPAAQYGYQILAGFGCGVNLTLLILMTPFIIEKRDSAVAMGAIAQFRVMGGCIGISILTAVANGYLQSHLKHSLEAAQMQSILNSAEVLSALPQAEQSLVRGTFSASYNLQMKTLAGLAGGQALASLLMLQKNQITV